MKKLILLFCVVVAACCYTACSNEEDIVNQQSLQSSELLLELQEYNASLTVIPQSRLGLLGWLSVGIADAAGAKLGGKAGGVVGAFAGPHGATVGAAIGGTIGAVAGSWEQYQRADLIDRWEPFSVNPSNDHVDITSLAKIYAYNNDSFSTKEYELGLSVGLDSASARIGILHNLILDEYGLHRHKSYPGQYKHLLSDVEIAVLESDEFKTTYMEIVNDPSNHDFNDKELSDRVMALFIEAIENSCMSTKDVNSVVSQYASSIKKSEELSDLEKQELNASFAVMSYSAKFWSERISSKK